jgi:hypothetical protein
VARPWVPAADIVSGVARPLAGLVIASLTLIACGSPTSAHASSPGARYYEQRHAKRQLGAAIRYNDKLPPPVCMRFPPSGPRIVAVVLGHENLNRVRAAFRRLHVRALFQISSISAYNARLARLYRVIAPTIPVEHRNLKLLRGRFPVKARPTEGITFEPLCPRVEIGIHAQSPRTDPNPMERTWAESQVRRYGSDFVSIYYGAFLELA